MAASKRALVRNARMQNDVDVASLRPVSLSLNLAVAEPRAICGEPGAQC